MPDSCFFVEWQACFVTEPCVVLHAQPVKRKAILCEMTSNLMFFHNLDFPLRTWAIDSRAFRSRSGCAQLLLLAKCGLCSLEDIASGIDCECH